MLCLGGGPVLRWVKRFTCQGWVSMLLWVGVKSFGVQGERWSMRTLVPYCPHPVGGLGTGQNQGVSWRIKVRTRDFGV